MQHQKAKHFKCNMCPRRLNTAGGLAVHIQQVHKLEPENLPRIENALPGRDGYEVEIFGMEGIPAPDVADYKRRKEIELGLAAGSISQPQPKRPKVENKPLSEEELRAQLAAHRALMGASSGDATSTPPPASEGGAVYGAPPQAYSAPPMPVMPGPPTGMSPPGMVPGAQPAPFLPLGGTPPVGAFPGAAPPFPPPFPGMSGFPPGPLPPGFTMPPPVGMPPSTGMLPQGMPPFPGMSRPPLGPPPAFVPAVSPFAASGINGAGSPTTPAVGSGTPTLAPQAKPVPPTGSVSAQTQPPPLVLPNAALEQKYTPFKKKTELKYTDPNFSPIQCATQEEKRTHTARYYFAKESTNIASSPSAIANLAPEEMRGKKRARAEDFL
ncbi:C2H2 finger domain-containing protein [Boletus reticuloceps]|uniref:C2H2 finger domain-containing protein n=1 Tax=Boletus reticuloceps TaxID=495285 RepID=A0A8I2YGZ2_9AGAM|nr:C2H2 finger domain-containing protein [Boletus reticuloceps]